MNTIKISICIATLNRGGFIGATLESIISQATTEVEIVVLDGASTDNTEEVVRGFQDRFPQLRYVRQDKNMGVDRDFTNAVALASGEYCWLFSDDDCLMPGAIQAVLDAIKNDYGVIVANTEVRDTSMSKVLLPNMLQLTVNRTYKPDQGQQFMTDLANYMTFIGCVIIKRKLWCEREKNRYFGSYFVHAGVIFQSPLPKDAFVIARPLISVRYGNAMWLGKYFEIWMFRWPDLIWSFADYTDSVKLQVCPREPWRRIRTLLIHRAKGTYTVGAYSKWLEERLESRWARTVSKTVAYLPGRLANFMAVVYYSLFYRRPDQPLVLVDLINSPFYFWRLSKSSGTTSATASM